MQKVIVKIGAEWCQPCKTLNSQMASLNDKLMEQDIQIQYFDIDENPEVAKEFGIRNIPALIMMHEGEEVRRLIGTTTKERLIDFIET